MRRRQDYMRILNLYLPLFLLLSFALFPYIWTILSSVKPASELFTKQIHYLPQAPTIKNYVSLFSLTNFLRYFSNSLIVALSTVVLATVISILAAYAFARFSFSMKSFLLVTVLVTTMFPKILLIIPLFRIFSFLGLMNTYIALILAHSTFTIPFAVWMLTGYLEMIPRELDEAALVDGCTKTQVLFKVILPLITPGIAATVVYIFIQSWNDYLYAVMFTSDLATRTLPVGLKMFVGKFEVNWGWLTAGGVITSVPIILFFFIVQRHLIKGLTAGAVKQ
ncbi:MAG TPA: carbohydrate ABC transporter permease [Candidatus Atribacteria bacterium]|nr:MAG: carbohydrate ABC transporter permease [Candidatus Nealsonbacteria bacterium]HDK26075.1 carbohydrate ABC transporter permease [Candidatus Atribacteria bacterium]